eukprot:TRINITY_DN1998_c0_g1_i2.p1 TRINITY_DN1998_c0_g1~~TRINITY_DN1998_c0_g1_i2.p1  ORF type:complete len:318 (+),score=43.54 TRINITY_DN1998_c0_g1_i2:105-1058(+)
MAPVALPGASLKFSDSYVLGKELNRGRFGQVHECKDRKLGQKYGCKVLSKHQLETFDELRAGVQILKSLDKESNIVHLHEVFEDDNSVYLVMDLFDGGDLFDKLMEVGRFSESAAQAVFQKIAAALANCHHKGVIHRDLKPENILVKKSDPRELEEDQSNFDLALADFGFATFCGPLEMKTGFYGSNHYMAPEIVAGESHNGQADVWSLGVLLYALLSGRLPFLGFNDDAAEEDEEDDYLLFESIVNGNVDFEGSDWIHVSSNAKHLLQSMLTVDPARRLTIDKVLRHSWLNYEANESEHIVTRTSSTSSDNSDSFL